MWFELRAIWDTSLFKKAFCRRFLAIFFCQWFSSKFFIDNDCFEFFSQFYFLQKFFFTNFSCKKIFFFQKVWWRNGVLARFASFFSKIFFFRISVMQRTRRLNVFGVSVGNPHEGGGPQNFFTQNFFPKFFFSKFNKI